MDAPLYEQIYNYIFHKIAAGELQPGDRVPSEKELSDQFNVSRITSKKALETLSANQLIERVQGKGSFVATKLPNLRDIRPLGKDNESGAKEKTNGNGKWKVVGVILPDFADSYGLRLLHGIEERCSELGCRMFMKLTYDKIEEEQSAIRSFIDLGVDGFVVFPVHGEHYNAELLRLVLDKYPLVLIDRYLKGIAACAVYTDNRKSAFDLTNVLLAGGHRRIGFISAPAENTSTIEDRIQGFTDAFIHLGMSVKPEHFMTNLYSSLPRSFEAKNINIDAETVRRFVEMNPELTAFVAAEYNLALILREVLISMGKRIPDDYQIVCFDSPDEPFGKHFFTHVRQNESAMGRMAVDLLDAQWRKEEVPLHSIIPYEVRVGTSTK